MRKIFICPKCGRELSGAWNYKQHLSRYSCLPKSNHFLKEDGTRYKYTDFEFVEEENKYKCPICNKLFFKTGIVNHYTHTHLEEGVRAKQKRVKTFKEGIANGVIKKSFKGKKHTTETKKKISESMKGNKNYNINKTGRGRKGYYKGIFCDSSYELAYVIYCIDHGIDIIRNTESFPYIFNGEKHLYYPDFIVNDEYIEIKGFWKPQVDVKASAVDKKIRVLYPKDMQDIFEYIKERYGKVVDKNIHELYE